MVTRRKCRECRNGANVVKDVKKARPGKSIQVYTTKNLAKANAVTHGGKFHADEVLATVILSKVLGKLIVYRAKKIPDNIPEGAIVYDIGGGKFDHHQKGGNGMRNNGIPYASAGLIWKEFGPQLVANTPNPEMVWWIMDRDLIQGVDATDNGACPKPDYPARALSLSKIVSGFKPTWDSTEDYDAAFLKAVELVTIVFDNCMKEAIAKAKAEPIFKEALKNSNDGIMVLETYIPWKEFIFRTKEEKAKELLAVVYPSDRGGYCWRTVPIVPGGKEQRLPVPEEWKGLTGEDLQKVSRIETADFCHQAGFTGGALTKEDALKMVYLAMRKKN